MKSPEELAIYVKKKLRNGYPDGELRNDLLKEGYSEEMITQAFRSDIASKGSNPTSNAFFQSGWTFIASGIFITGLAIRSVSMFAGWHNIAMVLMGAALLIIVIHALRVFGKK